MNRYLLVQNLIYKLSYRKFKDTFKNYKFYFACGVFIIGCILTLAATIIHNQIAPIFNSFSNKGNAEIIWYFLKGCGVSISMIVVSLYMFAVFLKSSESDFEKMLQVYCIPKFIRNICMANTRILIVQISCVAFLSIIFMPSVISSTMSVSLKILFFVFLFFQTLVSLLLIDVLYNFISLIIKLLKIPFAEIVSKTTLMLLVIYYFYFIFSSGELISLSYVYHPSYFASGIFIFAFQEMANLVNINVFLFIFGCLIIFSLYIFSNVFNETLSQSKHSFILLKNLSFSSGERSLIIKGIKENIRNKECVSTSIVLFMLLIGIRFINFEILENQLISMLFISLPTTNCLYAFSNDYAVKHLYHIKKISPRAVFFYNLFGPLLIAFIESLIIFFIIFSCAYVNILSCLSSFIFGSIMFYFLGLLFPINKKHFLNSSIIISSIMLALIPLYLIYAQTINWLQLTETISSCILIIIASILCSITFLIVKSKYGKIKIKGKETE